MGSTPPSSCAEPATRSRFPHDPPPECARIGSRFDSPEQVRRRLIGTDSLEVVNRRANHPNKGCSFQNRGTMIAASKSGDAERLRKIEGDFQRRDTRKRIEDCLAGST